MAVEKARLAESQARVRTALFALRQDVNDAFFAAALLQQRAQALAATIAELEARLRETNVRVREGAALPADAAAVEAALLQRRQDDDALRANRQSALKRLSNLTARDIGEDNELASPDLSDAVADARRAGHRRAAGQSSSSSRAPRSGWLESRTSRQPGPAAVVGVRQRRRRPPGPELHRRRSPGVRPGRPAAPMERMDVGHAAREREALACSSRSSRPTRRPSRRGFARATDTDSASIDRLQRAVALDDRIVELREQIDRTTEVRFREGVVTASEYVDRSTELLQARFARAGHHVELAQASARFLTTLGLEVR